MELLKLTPCSNTFFRDGHNFDAGISNYLLSKNTPYPTVFFGAIFTTLLAENEKFREAFFSENRNDHEKILKIGQIYLYDQERIYVSAPKDIFVNDVGDFQFSKFRNINEQNSSIQYDVILESLKMQGYTRADDYYIDILDLHGSYKKRQPESMRLLKSTDIFIKNTKIGIGLASGTKNVQESQLYKIQQTEFTNNKWSYLIEYSIDEKYLEQNYNMTLDKLDFGYLKLGGESKVCAYEEHENSDVHLFNNLKIGMGDDEFIKVILLSDTYFETTIDLVFSDDIKLIGLVNDKPIYIGGFDMKSSKSSRGQARGMYKGYSAGTIILLKINKEKISNEQVREFLNEKIIRNNSKGFGQHVVFKVKIHG